jgi:hypothetical protein
MVRGLPSFDHVDQFYDVCVLMKQRRLPFPQQSSFRAKERLKLVLLVDDLSHYMWVVVLGSKEEAANDIRRAHAAAEAECGRKLRVLRTDNGD